MYYGAGWRMAGCKYYYDLDVKEVSTAVEDGLREFFEGILLGEVK